ncbi:hypothetical protein [Cellulomonas sp.]|uniref:HAAS signaling domain-containing protein n=1 Tax=Cellulomonas sp. TaxID=40001 RepID=UPI002810ABD1|nr:hypothetical protein [Cellulomonas sp.]
MTAKLQHPLAQAYLDDLERALSGADPRERADTLASVREHLTEALPGNASSEDVRRVLAELGPVDAIASIATGAAPATSPSRPTRGLAVVATAAAIAGALLLLPVPVVGVPLALIGLVAAIVHLRTGERSGRPLARAALVVAVLTLLAAAVLALTLLAAYESVPTQDPVQTAPAR